MIIVLQFYLSEKKQIISQTEILEYSSVNEKIANLGGLDNLKDWLKKRKTAFSIQASIMVFQHHVDYY
jgi:hypothetical protein